MRYSHAHGAFVKQLSFEVRAEDHDAITKYARDNETTVDAVLRNLAMPLIKGEVSKQRRARQLDRVK